MSHADPIADMLTRIRNAIRVQREHVNIRASRVCEGIARVMQQEGYIVGYDRITTGNQDFLRVELKYGPLGEDVIHDIRRYSKPSCRRYCAVTQIPRVMGGLGIAIVSTSQGVLPDQQCRRRNIGGELLCMIS